MVTNQVEIDFFFQVQYFNILEAIAMYFLFTSMNG